ncbi:MAG: hypothetical protein GY847_11380 [Proteobacteria bacterium]|nr:hypothetical protein [Pseudomonadota bacterium]
MNTENYVLPAFREETATNISNELAETSSLTTATQKNPAISNPSDRMARILLLLEYCSNIARILLGYSSL